MLDLDLALEIKGLQHQEIQKCADMFERLSKRIPNQANDTWLYIDRVTENGGDQHTELVRKCWKEATDFEAKAKETKRKAYFYRKAYNERGVFDSVILLAEYNRDLEEGDKLKKLDLPKLDIKSIENPDTHYDSPSTTIHEVQELLLCHLSMDHDKLDKYFTPLIPKAFTTEQLD